MLDTCMALLHACFYRVVASGLQCDATAAHPWLMPAIAVTVRRRTPANLCRINPQLLKSSPAVTAGRLGLFRASRGCRLHCPPAGCPRKHFASDIFCRCMRVGNVGSAIINQGRQRAWAITMLANTAPLSLVLITVCSH